MNMIEVKTAALSGSALDWAVAIIEGYDVVVHGVGTYRHDKRGGIHCCKYGCTFGPRSITHDVTAYSPSEDWSQGGPLIEKYKAFPGRYDDECEDATEVTRFFCSYGSLLDMTAYCEGPTPLIAACRAIVAAKLGETVSVPAELVETKK